MTDKFILSIDPANEESAWVLMRMDDLKPLYATKEKNEDIEYTVANVLEGLNVKKPSQLHVAIEMIQSYGMPVGSTTFETCLWIGRFREMFKMCEVTYIYRKEEKLNLCHTMKATDATITQALIDRFAPHTPNRGKGHKNDKGWFYGFKKDIWQAYAVGVTYYDIHVRKVY